MQKMTVMALPKSVIDSMGNQRSEIRPLRRWNFSKVQQVLAQRGNIFFYGLAFFLGRLVFLGELAPFGLGFFAAVAQTSFNKTFGVGLAVLLGVVSTGRYEEVAIYLLAMGIYFKLRPHLTRLDRQMFAIPVTMFFSVLIGGCLLNYLREETLYLYMTVSFNALLCMFSAQLFQYGIPLLLDRTLVAKAYQKAAGEEMICLIVILALAVAGMGEISILGYQLQHIMSSMLVMLLALAGGAGLGAAVGVVVGLVNGLGGSGQALPLIALYAVSGTIAGVFKSLGKFAVLLGFIFGSLIIHFSFTQIPLLMAAVTEEVLAALLVLLLPVSSLLNLQKEALDKVPLSAERILAENGNKMQDIAGIFYEISALLNMKRQPEDAETKQQLTRLLTAIGEQVCEKCPQRPLCWEENYYRTYQHMLSIFYQLGMKPLQGRDLPLAFREDCMQAGKIVAVVNEVMEKNQISIYWKEKLGAQKQLMGEQMKAAGNIIANLAQEISKPLSSDGKLAYTLQKKAAQIGCPVRRMQIFGKEKVRRIEFEKTACGKIGECVTSLMPIVAGSVQERLTLVRTCGNAELGISCKVCMYAAPRFCVKAAIASIAKEGKAICGDSIKITPLDNGRIGLVLSDGMGSGNNAAKESKLTVECLSKLLVHNFDLDVAVKIVNSLLLLEASGENFATVDMAIVDQYTGEAEFLKIASAPSFVKRIKEVTMVCGKALPIGILNQIEIEPIKVQLALHDILIMVSDGIADLKNIKLRSTDKDGWLVNFIRRSEIEDEKRFAEALLAEAVRLSDGRPQDDMSVMVMRLAEEKLN